MSSQIWRYINGQPITWGFRGKVLKSCGGDERFAGGAFYGTVVEGESGTVINTTGYIQAAIRDGWLKELSSRGIEAPGFKAWFESVWEGQQPVKREKRKTMVIFRKKDDSPAQIGSVVGDILKQMEG